MAARRDQREARAGRLAARANRARRRDLDAPKPRRALVVVEHLAQPAVQRALGEAESRRDLGDSLAGLVATPHVRDRLPAKLSRFGRAPALTREARHRRPAPPLENAHQARFASEREPSKTGNGECLPATDLTPFSIGYRLRPVAVVCFVLHRREAADLTPFSRPAIASGRGGVHRREAAKGAVATIGVYSARQASMTAWACSSESNQLVFRHSLRKLPLSNRPTDRISRGGGRAWMMAGCRRRTGARTRRVGCWRSSQRAG